MISQVCKKMADELIAPWGETNQYYQMDNSITNLFKNGIKRSKKIQQYQLRHLIVSKNRKQRETTDDTLSKECWLGKKKYSIITKLTKKSQKTLQPSDNNIFPEQFPKELVQLRDIFPTSNLKGMDKNRIFFKPLRLNSQFQSRAQRQRKSIFVKNKNRSIESQLKEEKTNQSVSGEKGQIDFSGWNQTYRIFQNFIGQKPKHENIKITKKKSQQCNSKILAFLNQSTVKKSDKRYKQLLYQIQQSNKSQSPKKYEVLKINQAQLYRSKSKRDKSIALPKIQIIEIQD